MESSSLVSLLRNGSRSSNMGMDMDLANKSMYLHLKKEETLISTEL